MTEFDDARREIEALRERTSTLSAAVLRIHATLDLDTVLAEVLESARGLTAARCGVIATVDEVGAPQDFVFSGFTPEEQQELAAWPDGGRLFQHLRELPGPLRLADLAGYVRSLGMAPTRTFSRTCQGAPMRHRGADVGHFFLGGKANGEEFTDDDEDVLMLFASQAAAAIANARTHRNEQRARADLEALVETSPVGVVVFDAETGQPTASRSRGLPSARRGTVDKVESAGVRGSAPKCCRRSAFSDEYVSPDPEVPERGTGAGVRGDPRAYRRLVLGIRSCYGLGAASTSGRRAAASAPTATALVRGADSRSPTFADGGHPQRRPQYADHPDSAAECVPQRRGGRARRGGGLPTVCQRDSRVRFWSGIDGQPARCRQGGSLRSR